MTIIKQPTLAKAAYLIAGLGILTGISVILSLFIGSSSIPSDKVLAVLLGGGTELHQTLVLELRLPRALIALTTGALLAIAGVLMQVLLRNPLADPYVLGVSSGASVAALIAMLFGLQAAFITGSAFLGALFSIFSVFILAQGKGGWTVSRLLLTGVVMAAGWTALISFILVIAPPDKVQGMLFWMMGDLSYDRPLVPGLITLLIGLVLTLPLCRQLNVMIWGERQAASLGVNVRKLRLQIFFISALLTAGAVSLAGGIGFVGLVVPHFVR